MSCCRKLPVSSKNEAIAANRTKILLLRSPIFPMTANRPGDAPMKKLVMAVMLATMTMPVFALAASTGSPNRPYKHESACMYQGYPCSEWTRDDGW